jgi:PhnB protein
MAVNPIPDGHHSVTPYLLVDDAAALIDYVKRAFGAIEVQRMATPEGRVAHAHVRIGDSAVLMGEPPGREMLMPGSLLLYVPDVDATYQAALAAGGVSVMPVVYQFYGDRMGGVKDPAGNLWWIATHVEDVPPDEMKRREAEHVKKRPARG